MEHFPDGQRNIRISNQNNKKNDFKMSYLSNKASVYNQTSHAGGTLHNSFFSLFLSESCKADCYQYFLW